MGGKTKYGIAAAWFAEMLLHGPALVLGLALMLGACQVDNEAQDGLDTLADLDSEAPTFSGVGSISDVKATSFTVTWSPANDHGQTPPAAIAYQLFINNGGSAFSSGSAAYTSVVGGTTRRVSGLSQASDYCAAVQAIDQGGNADGNGAQLCVTTPSDTAAPAFAGAASATLTQASPPRITVTWPAAIDDHSAQADITYAIYRAGAYNGHTFVTPLASVTGQTSYADASVTGNTTFYYVVRAQDESQNQETNLVQVAASTPYAATGTDVAHFPGLQHEGHMGGAVALLDWDGDGAMDIAAGAWNTGHPGAGVAAYRAGQVSIYLGQGDGTFAQDPAIQFYSPNPTAQGYFGRALAVCDLLDDGTADDMVVGAMGEQRVYLYVNGSSGQDTTADRTISAPGAQGDTDNYGEGVACGRFDGTGGDDIVEAAPAGDSDGANTGRLFFYNNASTGGVVNIDGPESSYFLSPATSFALGTQPWCGQGLALADFDGDALVDLVVGCPLSDAGGTNDGTVVFYKKAGANVTNDWAAAGSTDAPNTGDRWGAALAAGNLNDAAAGIELAVGQPDYDTPGINAGAVTLHAVTYSAPNFSVAAAAALIPDRGPNGRYAGFGNALAAADIDGDGAAELVVGAPEEDFASGSYNTVADLGHFYFFAGTAGGILDGQPEQDDFSTNLTSLCHAVHGGTYDIRYGLGLCTGDINNDGRDDVLIGAENDSSDGPAMGRVYVWLSQTGLAIDLAGPPTGVFTSPGFTNSKRFGTSCLVMDMDGDGRNDVLVGTRYADDNQPDQGAVYIYRGVASTSTGGSNTGSVTLGSNPDQVLFVPADTATNSHYFGKSLAACDLTGDGFAELIVGAPAFDGALTNLGNARGSTNEGAVFVFSGSASGVNTSSWQGIFPTDQNDGLSLFGQPAYSDDNFGYAVTCFPSVAASSGMDLVVGAPFADKVGGNANQGMVAIFYGATNEDPTAYCASNDFVGSTCLLDDTRDVRLDDQGPVANDDSYFGSALTRGEWDGLGGADLVVGSGRARQLAPQPNNNGGVYAFRGASTGGFLDLTGGVPLSAFSYLDPTNFEDNRFGEGGLALSDIDNNGTADLLVGAYRCSYDDAVTGNRGSTTGCVFIDRGDYVP